MTEKKKCCKGRRGVVRNRKKAKPVRPSCLECVEKHLGAAWVLIAEHRDGYPHKTLAVGHLHEAEDESQEWSELHDSIREVRKEYQQRGKIPEMEKLSLMIEEIGKTIEDDLTT